MNKIFYKRLNLAVEIVWPPQCVALEAPSEMGPWFQQQRPWTTTISWSVWTRTEQKHLTEDNLNSCSSTEPRRCSWSDQPTGNCCKQETHAADVNRPLPRFGRGPYRSGSTHQQQEQRRDTETRNHRASHQNQHQTNQRRRPQQPRRFRVPGDVAPWAVVRSKTVERLKTETVVAPPENVF